MSKVQAASIPEQLLKALATVERPGDFCTLRSAAVTLPGLEVDGVGPVALPLTEAQCAAIKGRSEQAPHGQGEKTVVDTNIRRVWRLKPNRFKLANPAWETLLEEMVAGIQADLGLEGHSMQAHLYELLLYEPGGFFLPHKDGEKLDRMVATLVITLPCEYTGGELVVRFDGREKRLDASADSRFKIHYAAFYADCEHEVKPLRSGHRLCLIYNLTLAKKAVGAPRLGEPVANLADILQAWAADEMAPTKLALTLSHQYSQPGLAWDALKGVDRARAEVLRAAAEEAECIVHLAQVTLFQSGGTDDGYEEQGWGYRRRSHQPKPTKHTFSEIYATTLTADHWRDRDGKASTLGSIPVEEYEVVPPESLTAIEPEENFQGYTGNEGMTLERWYRHAAVVLWPKAHHDDVLCQAGSRSALSTLKKNVSASKSAQGVEAAALREQCLAFAGKILANWPECPWASPQRLGAASEAVDPLACLERLGDPKLVGTYLAEVLVRDATVDPGKKIVKPIARRGWENCRGDLVKLFKATSLGTLERNMQLLEHLCSAAAIERGRKRDKGEAVTVCKAAAEAMAAASERIDVDKDAYDWRRSDIQHAPLLAAQVRGLVELEADDLLSRLIVHAQNVPARYPLRDVQLPALDELLPWLQKRTKPILSAISKWVAACISQLESLTAAEPQPPADFRRDAAIDCKCRDCAELKAFLVDPAQPAHEFRMAENRRRHLEQQISRAEADLVRTTIKHSNPHILHCKKNIATYDRNLAEYRENVKSLARLRAF